MSYIANETNNLTTFKNSLMSHYEDKLHLPTYENKDEEPEFTVINIVGYIEQDDFSISYSTEYNILPLTVQDLDKKNVKTSNSKVITNFIGNLISANQKSDISNVLFTSIKSLKSLFGENNEKPNLSPNNYSDNYCDAV